MQNSAARVITQQRCQDHLHITLVLIALHCLPWRITYKILVLTFRAIHDLAPEYIADMITEYTPRRQLRSAGSRLLRVPRHNLERFGRRGFSVTAPRLWNDLPDSLRLIDSLELVKSNLKTHILRPHLKTTCRVFYNELILIVIIVVQFIFTYVIIMLLIYFIIYLLFYVIYLLLISLAYELGVLEALFNYLFIIILHFVFTC